MKRIISFFTLCLLSGLLAVSAAAQPDRGIWHIVTTVGENPAAEITVNYHCNDGGSYVLYTSESDTAFEQAKKAWPVCQRWSTQGIPNTAPASTFYTQERYVCYATLTGLAADTRYRFKIVSDGTESDVRTFRTAGARGDWNFVAFTDFQHRENPVTLPLIQMMKELAGDPALMVCSGDMVDVAGNEYEWTYLLDNDIFRDFVYAASPGDHAYWACDRVNGGYPQYDFAYTFNRLFHFPDNGATSCRNTSYWFRYNNVLFVALDMNNSDIATGSRFTDQVRWFEETLDRLAGTYQYLVVFEHKSIFGSDEVDHVVSQKLRPQWAPVFQKYRVDLVLSGHDHIYSRTYGLDGDQPAKDPLLGTFYLDMGSSGDKRRPLDKSLTESTRHAKVLDLPKLGQSCACNIEVSDTGLEVTVYNQYRQVVDNFSIPRKQRMPAAGDCRDPREFLFVQMTDTQIGFHDPSPQYIHSDTLMRRAVAAVNALGPEMVFITGDLVDNPADSVQEAIFSRNLAALQAPVWCIPGNHDIRGYTKENHDAYVARRGYDRFSFQVNGCAFVGFDSNCFNDGATEAAVEQWNWLSEQLRGTHGARYVFVFVHCPIVRESLDEPEDYFNFSKEQRRRFLDLFHQNGVDAVFAGHTHCPYATEVEGIGFYTAGAVGNNLNHGFPGFHVIRVGPDGYEVNYVPSL